MLWNNLLLGVAAVMLLLGFLLGWRRGCARTIVRLLTLVAMAFVAFGLSGVFSDSLMAMTITFQGESVTVHECITNILNSVEELKTILSYSPTLNGYVMALPDAICRVVLFVPIFLLLQLVTWPINAILAHFILPIRNRDNSKKKRMPILGALFGLVQGVFCFSVVLVLVFGVHDVCGSLVTAYRDSGYSDEQIDGVVENLEASYLDPLDKGVVGSLTKSCGIRFACVGVFHRLARVNVVTAPGQEKTVEYFNAIKGLMPTVTNALKLTNIDPSHMTADDTKAVLDTILSVKDNEDGMEMVREAMNSIVETQVDESYKKPAGAFLDKFLNVVATTDNEKLESVDVEAEAKTIESCLQMLASASSEASDTAFETVDATKMIETVAKSELAYTTLTESATDEEMKKTFEEAVSMNESSKQATIDALEEARTTLSSSAADEAELAKIAGSIDAVYTFLGLTKPE